MYAEPSTSVRLRSLELTSFCTAGCTVRLIHAKPTVQKMPKIVAPLSDKQINKADIEYALESLGPGHSRMTLDR